jgi:hypothetical protein
VVNYAVGENQKKLKLPWSHGKPFRWKKRKTKKKKIKLAGGKFRKEKMEFIENYTIHTKIRRKKSGTTPTVLLEK